MNNRILCVAMVVYLLIPLQILATGKITRIAANGSSIELTIETTIDETYQVQYCDNLSSWIWVNAEASFQASAEVSIKIFAANQSSCSFRVIKEEPISFDDPPPPPSGPPPPPPPI